MENSITEAIGCDLGDKMSEICVLRTDGTMQWATVRTTRAGMRLFFTRARAHVVMEVGGHSRWASALLRDLGHRVTVANARRVQLISQSNNKTDQNDAELLARLGRADIGLLSPVVHRKPETQADLAVAKARDVLVATRTRLVNYVRGTMKSFGDRIPKCRAETFVRHTRDLVPELLKPALEPLTPGGLLMKAANAQVAFERTTTARSRGRSPRRRGTSRPSSEKEWRSAAATAGWTALVTRRRTGHRERR